MYNSNNKLEQVFGSQPMVHCQLWLQLQPALGLITYIHPEWVYNLCFTASSVYEVDHISSTHTHVFLLLWSLPGCLTLNLIYKYCRIQPDIRVHQSNTLKIVFFYWTCKLSFVYVFKFCQNFTRLGIFRLVHSLNTQWRLNLFNKILGSAGVFKCISISVCFTHNWWWWTKRYQYFYL